MTEQQPQDAVFHVEARGEGATLIVFAPRFSDGFAFRGVTAPLPCNRVLVRDPTLCGWYNADVPRPGAGLDDLQAELADIVAKLGGERLAVMGSSMGGYAALLLGSLLKANQILAFNPQTVLDPIFPLGPPADRPRHVGDVRAALEAGGSTTSIVVGEEDPVDIFNGARLSDLPNVQVFCIPGSTHMLTDELNMRGELLPLIGAWLSGKPLRWPRPAAWAADALFRNAIKSAVMAFFQARYEDAVAPFALAASLAPELACLPHFLGCALYEIGRFEAAAVAQLRACQLRPDWQNSAEHFAQAVTRAGLDRLTEVAA